MNKDKTNELKEIILRRGEISSIEIEGVQGVDGVDGKDGEQGLPGKDGSDGKDYILTDLDKEEIASSIEVPIVEKIIEQPIVKEVAKYKPIEETISEINSLSTDNEDLKIDFVHIKGAPKFDKKVGGAVARNVYQLGDVSLSSLTDGDGLFWDDTNKVWANSAPSGGGHTIQDDSSSLTARTNLDFQNYFTITDNSGADATEVDINTTQLFADAQFDIEVSANSDVTSNTSSRHDAVTFAGTGTYISLSGQQITVDPITESDISDLQSYLLNVVEDTTPQLGGNLDVNSQSIVSTSNGNITLTPNGTGNVVLGAFTLDADQTVGAGQDNYVLTYDNGTGLISLEAAAGSSVSFGADNNIPYTNAATNDFDYSTGFFYDHANHRLGVMSGATSASFTGHFYTNQTAGTASNIKVAVENGNRKYSFGVVGTASNRLYIQDETSSKQFFYVEPAALQNAIYVGTAFVGINSSSNTLSSVLDVANSIALVKTVFAASNTGTNNGYGVVSNAGSSGNASFALAVSGVAKGVMGWLTASNKVGWANFAYTLNDFGLKMDNVGGIEFVDAATSSAAWDSDKSGNFQIHGSLILDAVNITTDTTTGTKIGTATTQKFGFFNATPIVQQTTTSQTPATFTANSSGISDDTATWNGYTIGDIVAILQAYGLIA